MWKICLTSLIIREIQITSTLSPHTYQNDHKTPNGKCRRGFRGKGPSHTVDGTADHYNHFGKEHGDDAKN